MAILSEIQVGSLPPSTLRESISCTILHGSITLAMIQSITDNISFGYPYDEKNLNAVAECRALVVGTRLGNAGDRYATEIDSRSNWFIWRPESCNDFCSCSSCIVVPSAQQWYSLSPYFNLYVEVYFFFKLWYRMATRRASASSSICFVNPWWPENSCTF